MSGDRTSGLYWWTRNVVLGPATEVLFRPWVKGLKNIPATGGAILASNHLSVSDSIFLPIKVPRPVVFLAKMEYFQGTGIKGRATRAFMRMTNQLPMDRSGGRASAHSLSSGEEALKEGRLLGIYPEGTRSPDGRLYKGKIGVARLALSAQVPVIPVAMIGTDKVQPIGRKLPRVRRVGMIIGEPLDFSEFYDRAADRQVQRQVTDEIMYAIMRLSGQEYADVYGATYKRQLDDTAAGRPQRESRFKRLLRKLSARACKPYN